MSKTVALRATIYTRFSSDEHDSDSLGGAIRSSSLRR